jgi:hypothetical protein
MNEKQKDYILKTIALGRTVYLLRNSLMTALVLLSIGWGVNYLRHQPMGILDLLTYAPLCLVGSFLFFNKQWDSIVRQYKNLREENTEKPRDRGE